MARLDFFLISETLLDIYADSEIRTSYKSGNPPPFLRLFITKSKKRGKEAWKINIRLLFDQMLRQEISSEIDIIVSTYAYYPFHQDSSLRETDFNFMKNIDLF